jgi:hypothetical protein
VEETLGQLLRYQDDIISAQHKLVKAPPTWGSRLANDFLTKVVEDVVVWSMSLRPGSVENLVVATQKAIAEHVQAKVNGRSTGTRGSDPSEGEKPETPTYQELMQLLDTASGSWPAVDSFRTLRAMLSQLAAAEGKTEAVTRFAERAETFLKALAETDYQSVTIKEATLTEWLRSVEELQKLALEPVPPEVEETMFKTIAWLNADKAWELAGDYTQIYDVMDRLTALTHDAGVPADERPLAARAGAE